MFVGRKKNLKDLLKKKFRYNCSNIAFSCKRDCDKGFTKGRIYKPFAYSVCYNDNDYYTNFALFNNIGEVVIVTKDLVKKGFFKIEMFSELIQNEYVQYIEMMTRMNDIDESICNLRNKGVVE